ncbi:MAG: hypothetical protein AAGC81_11920 [Pseudomonadota bacterium]
MPLHFEKGICVGVDTSAPEITDIRTVRRFSSQAYRGFFLEATTFYLDLPSASDRIALSIRSARRPRPGGKASYFGQCSFTDGVGGFLKQVHGRGSCTVVGSRTSIYHSAPGSRENVIVRCNPDLPGVCYSMTLWHIEGPLQISISATIREPAPENWLRIADEIRAFLRKNVSHLPGC